MIDVFLLIEAVAGVAITAACIVVIVVLVVKGLQKLRKWLIER